MISTMRKGVTHVATVAILAGLLSAGPGNAVAADSSRIDLLTTTVGALEEPVAPVVVPEKAVEKSAFEAIASGEASYYGPGFEGNRTASGERFKSSALTAAHRTLPLGTKLRVTNKANGKSVIVRVNDRGPFLKHRIIDVSLAAAKEIQMIRSGKAQVTLEILRTA